MGLNHSPKIVTNGLVFAYDMGNTNKSWKGTPTTNRLPNATEFSGWSNYYRTLAKTSFTTQFGTTGWRFINQPSWSGLAIGYNVPSTGTYTFSAYYKYLGGTVNNNGGSVYVSGWGGGDDAAYVNKSLVGVWQRVQKTLNLTNLSGTFYLISFGGTDSGTTSPDNTSFEVTMPMIESGSLATPFVDGTRSSDQAILDLTRLNTVTASSLTYNSDNTFSFNGSSNLMVFPENSIFNTQTPSIEVWVKTNATTQNGFWFEKGTVNSQYALFQEGGSITWRLTTNVASLTAPTASYMNTSQYAQVVGTYTAGDRRLYVNGVQVASDTLNYSIPTNAGGCSIGAYGGFSGSRGYYFNGNIGLVKVYNRTLAPAEVQQNFNAHRGRYGI